MSPPKPKAEAEASPAIWLLLFEAADCLMALPASEVERLVGPAPGAAAEDQGPPGERIDLGNHFGGHHAGGAWLRWRRGDRRAWLRVGRVVEVTPCAIRLLAPMPAWLRASGHTGPFWAAGTRGDEVFLLLDPARLAGR